ncbi:hypothetical protein R83H12_00011 [Fibrobacteria bacterium R8-3-H12]
MESKFIHCGIGMGESSDEARTDMAKTLNTFVERLSEAYAQNVGNEAKKKWSLQNIFPLRNESRFAQKSCMCLRTCLPWQCCGLWAVFPLRGKPSQSLPQNAYMTAATMLMKEIEAMPEEQVAEALDFEVKSMFGALY